MSGPVSFERHGLVGVVRIDNPPLNALSSATVAGLTAAVASFESDATLQALLVHCDGRTFVAGGDITEFDSPDFDAAPYNATLARIEKLDRPVVAMLHGSVLGGGLELALACHYRVAAPGATFGFPEVTLGILPGSLGTQRLPRLAGVELALDLISSGRTIDARAALNSGIIDEIIAGAPLEVGVAFANSLIERKALPRRVSDMTLNTDSLPAGFFEAALQHATSRKSAYPAARAIVQCIEAAATLSFTDAEAVEARLFNECRLSEQSRAMRNLFFAQRLANKIPGLARDVALRPVRRVGIVGAGTMGGGIAMNFANAGIPVVLIESSQDALVRGLSLVRKNYDASAAKGKLTPESAAQRMALLDGTLDYAALVDCDLVIEAVFENLELKLQICAHLGQVCKPGAIIATNTSTLDVDVLAEATGRPADVVGMHFFSPANVMRLLEVVRGAKTAPEVLATVMHVARTIRKVAVVAGVCYGFIGNRMAEVYMREAEFLLMEGAEPQQIDAAVEALGMAMGPCRMLDMAGIDVGAKTVIEQGKVGGLPADPSYRVLVQELFALGRFGQKTAAGYYRYEGRTPVADPEVTRIAARIAAAHGITRRSDIDDTEIVERLLYSLINEGTLILEEAIAYRPGDIDVVWVCGYGFPDHRGGPMYMADQIGAAKIVERLEHYAQVRGNAHGYWTASTLLKDCASTGKRLSDGRLT